MKFAGRRSMLVIAVIAGAAGVWIAGVKLSERLLLRGLNAEVTSGDTVRGLRAVAKLEKLESRGVPVLATAANDSNEQVAGAAQRAIDQLLTMWQQERDATLTTSQFEQRLTQLAATLAETTAHNPTPMASDWSYRTAGHLLKLSQHIPPGDRVALIGYCEVVLDRTAGKLPTPPLPIPEPPELVNVPAKPIAITSAPNALRIRPSSPAEKVALPSTEASELRVIEPVETPAQTTSEPNLKPWQPRWNEPEVAPQVEVYSPWRALPLIQEAPAPQIQLSELTDRELLSIWLLQTAIPVGKPMLREVNLLAFRHELAARGHRDLREAIVLAALSNRANDRTKLVNLLLTSSVGDTPTWLLLLARDDAPQVRRAAISALLTSRDRRILAITYDLAIHDNDPQVAALAPKIGELLR